MFQTTNSLVVKAKRMAIPAGCASAAVLALTLMMNHSVAHAAIGAAAPLDQSAVSPLVALDNAVEAVAARVTPAVVSVSVTSKPGRDVAEDSGPESNGPV